MSEHSLKTPPSGTGVFVALPPSGSSKMAITAGNDAPADGKALPPPASKGPDLEAIAQQLNVASQSIGRDLRFQVNLETGRSVIHVLDRDTGEVIRQIPPEKAAAYVATDGAVSLQLYDEMV
jgi:flagellar protein FlaG